MRRHQPLLDLDLFRSCSAAEAARVRSLLTMISVPAGTVLMEEGAVGSEFLVIHEGLARVSVAGRTVAMLGRGDFVGEISLLERDPRSATVVAATPLTFYVCHAAEFAGILDIAGGVAERVRRAAGERRRANRRLAPAA